MPYSLCIEEQEKGSLWRPDQCEEHSRYQHQEPGQEGTQQHGGQGERISHGEF